MAGPEEEQGGSGVWQCSIPMVKAAHEIRGLWLQLSQNNGEAFLWSLHHSWRLFHSPTSAGAKGHSLALVGSGRAGLRLSHPPLCLLVSLKWVCFVQMEEQPFPALLQKPSEPPRVCGKTPTPSPVLLVSKHWEFCMKTTKETRYAEKQSSGEGWMGSM